MSMVEGELAGAAGQFAVQAAAGAIGVTGFNATTAAHGTEGLFASNYEDRGHVTARMLMETQQLKI